MRFHTEQTEVRAVFRPDDGTMPGWAGRLRQTVTTTAPDSDRDGPAPIADLPDIGWDRPDPAIEYPEMVTIHGVLEVDGNAHRASWTGDRFMPSA